MALTPNEIVALSKLIKKAEADGARDKVLPGTHSVNFDIHVEGSYEVEEDYLKDPTVSVPWTEAYALLREVAIQGVNELIARVDRGEVITREDLEVIKTAGFLSEDLIVDCIQKAFYAKEAAKGKGAVIALVPEVEAAQERAKEAISKRIGKTPSHGRVLTDLKVEQINQMVAVQGQIAQAIPAPTVQINP